MSIRPFRRFIFLLDSHYRGLLPSEAASEAIRIALRQLSYGLEPFKVQPVSAWLWIFHSQPPVLANSCSSHPSLLFQVRQRISRPVHIGLTHEGVAEFLGSKRTHLYKWYVFLCLTIKFVMRSPTDLQLSLVWPCGRPSPITWPFVDVFFLKYSLCFFRSNDFLIILDI